MELPTGIVPSMRQAQRVAAKSPHHPLETVINCARCKPPKVRFRYDKSVDIIVAKLDLSVLEAERFIVEHLAELTEDNFHDTANAFPPPADEYGIRNGYGRGWYIKLVLNGGLVKVISFHPPSAPLSTKAGTITR